MENKWAYSFNEENYYGECDTKEEAVEEAKEEMKNNGEQCEAIYVGRIEKPTYRADAEHITDAIYQNFYDQCGEYAEDWNPSEEDLALLQKKLDRLVNWWMKKTNNEPTFFTVWGIEEIKLEKEEESEYFCPVCGEELKDWGNGILDCESCRNMFDSEVLDEMEGE